MKVTVYPNDGNVWFEQGCFSVVNPNGPCIVRQGQPVSITYTTSRDHTGGKMKVEWYRYPGPGIAETWEVEYGGNAHQTLNSHVNGEAYRNVGGLDCVLVSELGYLDLFCKGFDPK